MQRCFYLFKLTVVFLTIALVASAYPALGASLSDLKKVESQLQETRSKLNQSENQKKDLQAEIATLDQRLTSLDAEISQLEDDLAVKRQEKQVIEAELQRLQAELAKTQAQLNKAIKRLTKLTKTLNRRAGYVYKNGDISFLEVLLEAKSFVDFLNRANFLQRIINLDASLVKQVKITKAVIEKARAQIEENKRQTQLKQQQLAAEEAKIKELVAEQKQKQAELKNEVNAKEQLVNKIEADQKEWEAAAAEFERSAAAIKAELARRAASGSNVVFRGAPSASGFIWPASGPVTSGFGPRWGRMHTGIDIAVPYGTPVVASKAGTVVIASWYGGYGNLVVIDHGNGVTTWYGHNSSFAVSVGQTVQQGQVIAMAGSTGNSTGPHVHFEIRFNYNPVNPRPYLP